MKKFNEFLQEGFDVNFQSKEITLDLDNNLFINTKLGRSIGKNDKFVLRQMYFKDFDSYCYSIYSTNNGSKNGTATEIKKALKGQSEFKITDSDIITLVSRAAILLNYRLKNDVFDLVINIESSSGFSDFFLDEFVKHLNYKPVIFKRAVRKNPNKEEIYIDDGGVLSEKTFKQLEQQLKKNFKIHDFLVKDRKFIQNWLLLDDKIKNKIQDKSICVIDDYLTSGSTIYETMKLLSKYEPKKITAITLIKGK